MSYNISDECPDGFIPSISDSELCLKKMPSKLELNFSNSTNYEKFLNKIPSIIKNGLFFHQIFFTVFVSNQRKKLFKMATLTFRVVDHIFFIWYLKNHTTFFWDFRSKLFGNILKIFLISCSKFFKLIFLESLAENIRNAYFHYIKTCLRFVGSTHKLLEAPTIPFKVVLENRHKSNFEEYGKFSVWNK